MAEEKVPDDFQQMLDSMNAARDHVASHDPNDALEAIDGVGDTGCPTCEVIESDILALLTTLKTAPGEREDDRYEFVLNELDSIIAWYEGALEEARANV